MPGTANDDPLDEDEDVGPGVLRGGANPAGVSAEPPNEDAPGMTTAGGATASPGNTDAPGSRCIELPDGGTSAAGVSAAPPNEEAPGSG